MLFTIFSPIQKRLCKLLKYQDVTTDNELFRLHCVFTVAVLFGSSVVLTSTQLIGTPIVCVGSNAEKVKDWAHVIETFCWVNSTYLMPTEIQKEMQITDFYKNYLSRQAQNIDFQLSHHGGHNTQMGMPSPLAGMGSETNKPRRYYTYYQWVCFVLFLQGLLCYLPKVLWKHFESGLLCKLTTGLHGICQKNEVEKRSDSIICYFQRYRSEHKLYALVYWFCEGLCLLNMALQMWAMNRFLGGNFFSIGVEALKNSEMSQYERTDALIYIFPRMTKCDFYYYGPSGSLVNMDSLCLLPQNIINEKVYIFLWFWYIILSSLFICVLIYRVVLIAMPSLRPRLLVARSRCISLADAHEVTSKLDIGDWWLLYMLAKNIDPLAYRDMLSEFLRREKKVSLYK